MQIRKVQLTNFRNYQQLEWEPHPQLNFLFGLNGQGKTNLLEAVYVGAFSRSYRGNDQELLQWQKPWFRIAVEGEKKSGPFLVELAYGQKRKLYKVNGLVKKKASDFIGNYNVVLFAPEHLALVKGQPAERRRFLDAEMAQTNRLYLLTLQKYVNLLKQKNYLLKEAKKGQYFDQDLLEVINQQLAEMGSVIIYLRLEAIKKLNPLARLIQRRLSQGREELEIKYITTIELSGMSQKEIKQALWQGLISKREDEKRRGQSLIGPHRDDLEIKINGFSVRHFGSQGQQRTSALALKLAELEYIKGEIGEYPLLLLDDVFSELDRERRAILVETISGRIQTIITTTSIKDLPPALLKQGGSWRIEGGNMHVSAPGQ